MVALSLQKKIKTISVIRKSRIFSANWLNYRSPEQRKYALDLARPGNGEDKLSLMEVPYFLDSDTPVLDQAEAIMLCRVSRILECGDHDLIVAKVSRARASGDFFPKRYWEFKKYKPMVYLGSTMDDPLSTIAGRSS